MAPRTMALPSAQTESARELRRTFFCELCQKGYARANEWEAHEGSYDHQHRKRLKEMKAMMTRNPTAAVKASRAEKRKNEKSEMISMNLKSETGRATNTNPSRPVGWPAEAAAPKSKTAGADKGEVKDQQAAAVQAPVEEKWVLRPVQWDELDDVDELVDLVSDRPITVQKAIDGFSDYMHSRGDAEVQAKIWDMVDSMRKEQAARP